MKLINLTKKYQGKYLTYYEARYINLDGKYKELKFPAIQGGTTQG